MAKRLTYRQYAGLYVYLDDARFSDLPAGTKIAIQRGAYAYWACTRLPLVLLAAVALVWCP